MNLLLNEIKLIETTKLNNTVITNCGAWGICPDLPYSRNGSNCKVLTDMLKGPHEEVPWVAPGQWAVG
jgi:hypothetical protein